MPNIWRISRPRPLASGLAAALIAIVLLLSPSMASASSSQISIMEPGGQLFANPTAAVQTLRVLGVTEIRLNLSWAAIAPDPASRNPPSHFAASNPAAYSEAGWAPYDADIRAATQAGVGIYLDVEGRAPVWAQAKNAPVTGQGSWNPSTSAYQSFVEAVGKRYSGTYTPPGASSPLPAVTFWSIWNEPDYTAQLKPQAIGNAIPNSPQVYRGLVDAAWNGLKASGHGHDKVLIGELAPRGYPHIQYGGLFPVTFVQSLYCLDSRYRPLRGSIAKAEGCPTNAAGTRSFRSANPGLFNAYGFSDHPYMRWYPPNSEQYYTCKTGLCTSLADYGNLTSALDQSLRADGSNKKYSIFSTEFGYQTSPPKPYYNKKDKAFEVPVATAAMYLNWAEYLSYKNPRIGSYDQYLLADPPSTAADNFDPYASGIEFANGQPKPGYYAFALPLFLPKTNGSHGQSLEVWGGVRAAPFASLDVGGTHQTVEIQFAPKGSSTFSTVSTVTITNPEGYFDTHVAFPSSGTVRLQYTYPTTDMLLAPGVTIDSRDVSVTIH